MTSDAWPIESIAPRARVLTDNDYGGDPDGLVELAQLLLSPSVEVAGVIGSRAGDEDGWDASHERAIAEAQSIIELTGRAGTVSVLAGAERALPGHATPDASAAADAITAAAMRDDSDLPLYVTCGAGLTQIASAWLTEPQIGTRLTLIWIGGSEHSEHARRPPGLGPMEYNLAIDPIAAQVVFNESDIEIWQVPRNLYRTVLASRTELLARMAPHGALGRHLFESLGTVAGRMAERGIHLGETYVLGDSPLVLLTALQTAFQPDPASSSYVTMPCPRILDSGEYAANPNGRPVRVYTQVDTRLVLEDLYAKVALHAAEFSL
jgi:inosine-uridine nucleoside N-ribohydrolase